MNVPMNSIPKFLAKAVVAAVALLGVSAISSSAHAVTYNLTGTSLGIITNPNANQLNDPAPDVLICDPDADTCNSKKGDFFGTYTGGDPIESANLWKTPTVSQSFSLLTGNTGTTSGTWQQIWQGTPGELLTHYAAVKAANSYHLIGYDLSAITAALVFGDKIIGSWDTGGILNNGGNEANMSHVSLYNSAPPSVSAVPIPAALPLLMSAFGLFGFMGWRRKRKAPAAA